MKNRQHGTSNSMENKGMFYHQGLKTKILPLGKCIQLLHRKGTSTSRARLLSFSYKTNKTRLLVFLEILEREVPGRASILAQLTCPSPQKCLFSSCFCVLSTVGSGPWYPSRSRAEGSALSDPITGMGRVGDSKQL